MLTLAQQYALDDCLRQQNLLTNEALILELTDHFILSLDQHMANGVSFEIALTAIVSDFGGREELQRMERRYNRVTFGRYTAIWAGSASRQFKAPIIWLTLAVFGFVFYLNAILPATTKVISFLSGVRIGMIAGLLVGMLGGGSRYVASLFRRGYHNPPTEVQFILTRMVGGALLLLGIGEAGLQLAESWPILIHPVIVAFYVTSIYVCLVSCATLYRHLYEIDSPIANG